MVDAGAHRSQTRGGPSHSAARSENFPVASRLIAPRARRAMGAFYDFARTADDVADDPGLGATEKRAQLDALAAGLAGAGRSGEEHPVAGRLRRVLDEDGHPDALRHAAALLGAFRQDAAGARYETWEDLLAYCRMSADPVGRFVLDIHGEGRGTYAASDALCTALQILNHIQDLGDDHRRLGRLYLPAELLSKAGSGPQDVAAPAMGPALRRAVDAALARTRALLGVAGRLPSQVASGRLAGEVSAILFLAGRLQARLEAGDPLARRIAPGRLDMVGGAIAGLAGLLAPRGRAA